MINSPARLMPRNILLAILAVILSLTLHAQRPIDSLLSVRRDLSDILDSARAGTTDTTVLSLSRVLMASEDLLRFDNELIGQFLSVEKKRADSLQVLLNVQQTTSMNETSKLSDMNQLILAAWAITALALFFFLIMMILYIRARRARIQLSAINSESEKILAEYRKKMPEMQAELDYLKEMLEEKNPEKDYLKEKLKKYQDEMDRIGADKHALVRDIQNILDRVKDL
jgi:C4-dicarboxylate-specific signal transduction histidine kinase